MKNQPKVGSTVFIRVSSGAIISGTVRHVWQDKSVQMVRVESSLRVYNIPTSMLVHKMKHATTK